MNEIVEIALQAMLLGIFMALIYDVLRFARFMLKKPPNWLVSVLDILWFVFYAFCMFLFIMTTGNGVLRLYHFMFAFLGTASYLFSIGRVTNFIFLKITKAIRFILALIFMPVKKICMFFKQNLGFIFVHIYRFFIKMFKNIKKYLLKRVEMLYNYIITLKTKKSDKDLHKMKGSVRENEFSHESGNKKAIKATVTRKI